MQAANIFKCMNDYNVLFTLSQHMRLSFMFKRIFGLLTFHTIPCVGIVKHKYQLGVDDLQFKLQIDLTHLGKIEINDSQKNSWNYTQGSVVKSK